MTTTKKIIPAEATHPGVLIKDELDATPNLNQKQLAKELDVKPSFLNEIIKGKRPITADLAVQLEAALGISAEYWIRFQLQYEVDLARRKEKNIEKVDNIRKWNEFKEYVPIGYLNKHNYLSETLAEDIVTIKKIYNIEEADEIASEFACFKETQASYYRKSDKLKVDDKNMFAWTKLAYYDATKQEVASFSFDSIDGLVTKLNKLFFENDDTLNRVKSTLNEFGVKFLLIEKLQLTPVDGLTFWSGQNPAIALTLRHKRIDNFAFTIMHEIGHIDLHLSKDKEQQFIDLAKIESIGKHEEEANRYAQKKLIANDMWQEIAESSLSLTDDKLMEWSVKYAINPAIILGRHCFETDNYAVKTKISKELK